MNLILLAEFVCLLAVFASCYSEESFPEIERYDGWYNNLANPDWGSVGSRLHRKLISAYADGVHLMPDRPNARKLSDLIFKGEDGRPNARNLTALFAFFSQMVAYEIMSSSESTCPIEMVKVQMERCDPVYDSNCQGQTMMPFLRAQYDKATGQSFNAPREQVNSRTAWLDASFLYSVSEPWVNAMRKWSNGSLLENNQMPGYPPLNNQRLPLHNPPPPQVHKLMNPERLFLLGDPRTNENPALLSFGLMLFRWHNLMAQKIQTKYPHWSDQKVYHRARQWVIATMQKIIFYDFLPVLIGKPVTIYQGYNPDLPPGISHIFSSAAFRQPHTLVPPGIFLRNKHCHYRKDVGGYPALRLCNTWWNAQDIIQSFTMDDVILGMCSQIAEKEDSIIVDDLRDFLFGPMHFSRRDLGALSILRGRDNGLPDYNTVRKAFKLSDRNWTTINPEDYKIRPQLYEQLRSLYNDDITKLDIYVGGSLESNGEGPGELFTAIIEDQFYRLRDADRFWFENENNGFFTFAEVAEIRNTTLRQVLLSTTNISADLLQDNVFIWKTGDPCPQPFQLNSSVLEPCLPFMQYDHFQGNEVSFIFTCIFFGLIPCICYAFVFLVTKQRNHIEPGRIFGININGANLLNCYKNKTCVEKIDHSSIVALEWLHEDHSRKVHVTFADGPQILLQKRHKGSSGNLLRVVNLQTIAVLNVYVSNDSCKYTRPTILIALPNHYDLVLRFECHNVRDQFLSQMAILLEKYSKAMRIIYLSIEELLNSAETKEKRHQKLEHFFREAYALSFGVPALHNADMTHRYLEASASLLNTNLNRAEFAEALGMHERDLFVQRMFSCVAKNHPDQICFQEFLNTMKLFSNGSVADKLQIIFDLCDHKQSGIVEKNEFCAVMKSIVNAVGTELNEHQQLQLVDSALVDCGIPAEQKFLTRKDFELLLDEVKNSRKPIGLHVKGRQQNFCHKLSDCDSLNSFALPPEPRRNLLITATYRCLSLLEDYRQQIVYLILFSSFAMLIFINKFWEYYESPTHIDLQRVMGSGIAFTRGAAAVISFCFALLPLTVCRNLFTLLRESWLNQFVPFDSAIIFHKIVAFTALLFATIHTVGHVINFYQVSTQPQDELNCLFPDALFSSDFQPSINYWLFETITGVSGILLVVAMTVMYIFATPFVIARAYHAFRFTHFLHVIIYALTVAHGLPKLLDKPSFGYYIVGPLILFVIDRIIGMKQKYRHLQITESKLLISDVSYVSFARPRNFHFRSGQWVLVSCPQFQCKMNEWHAFSVASSPQQSHLEIYVKAQGPWTWKLRRAIYEAQQSLSPYPTLKMLGPFGAGNQEWWRFPVSVMVGGGIGVTPYASILADLIHATQHTNSFTTVTCKKVYFLWVCPTHRNFEWFVDVLRNIEVQDTNSILQVHIFITQVFHKFDLRTTMLYICEKHFQRIQSCSMFTGLRAQNHFGRPDMTRFLRFVQNEHQKELNIGVFSCGPASLNKSVRTACDRDNQIGRPHLIHRYETF